MAAAWIDPLLSAANCTHAGERVYIGVHGATELAGMSRMVNHMYKRQLDVTTCTLVATAMPSEAGRIAERLATLVGIGLNRVSSFALSAAGSSPTGCVLLSAFVHVRCSPCPGCSEMLHMRDSWLG